jgi:hypothetical protein
MATRYPNKYSKAVKIDQVGKQPQHGPISASMADYAQTDMRFQFESIAEGQTVKRAATLRQAKVMMEIVRGQIG